MVIAVGGSLLRAGWAVDHNIAMLYMVLDAWRVQWADLVDFDVLPVITSSEAAQRSGARHSPPGAGDTGTSGPPELSAAGKPSLV